jgi:hypothetical protein
MSETIYYKVDEDKKYLTISEQMFLKGPNWETFAKRGTNIRY